MPVLLVETWPATALKFGAVVMPPTPECASSIAFTSAELEPRMISPLLTAHDGSTPPTSAFSGSEVIATPL